MSFVNAPDLGALRPRQATRRRFDVPLLLGVGLLMVIGAVSVYAATRNGLVAQHRSGTAYLKRDLLNAAVALVVCVSVARLDYRQLRPWAPIGYVGLTLLLLAVLTPLGSTINGAHGWFSFGPVQLEPSEFMKLALIVLASALLSERPDWEGGPSRKDIILALAAAAVPVLLVLAEPALGIAIVLAVIAVAVLALSGAPARWTVALLLGAVAAGALAFSLHVLKPYQQDRFTAFTDPGAVRQSSAGYQLRQSQIAIGAGGLTGQGFLAGSQTDGGFIPEQQTDFVFTVSAEEGGLLAGSLLVFSLGVVLWRGISIAEAAPDVFGRLLAGGVVTWLAFQSFVNIGMTLGIMPVTGLPLPFVSYGGSALLADGLGVALLLSVRAASPR